MNPLLLEFPDHFETERLLIRVPNPDDAEAINAGIRESINELRIWMDWALQEQDIDTTRSYARRGAANFLLREDLPLTLWDKATGEFIGGSGLHRVNWSIPSFEIGYWVRTSKSGQGYITEAVNGITDFAFNVLNAQRVEIRCDQKNERSAAVAERCGYQLEGYFRKHMRTPQGTLRDTLVYARVRE